MSYFEDVRAWHRAFGVPVADRPQVPSQRAVLERYQLMAAEWRELHEELMVYPPDLAKVAKEGMDVIYTVPGMFAVFGIPADAVWEAVSRSNWAKRASDGTVLRDDTGKILKPEGWQPPDIAAVLRDAA